MEQFIVKSLDSTLRRDNIAIAVLSDICMIHLLIIRTSLQYDPQLLQAAKIAVFLKPP